MSRQIARDLLSLRPTPRVGHTEYSMEYHHGFARRAAGGDPEKCGPLSVAEKRAFYDAWDFDLLWGTQDGLIDWFKAGRATDMGHAVYAADGSDRKQPKRCPFEDPEEVLEFDPAREYGFPGFSEQVKAYQALHETRLIDYPNQLVSGGYYKTVISGAIQTFGWDLLLEAAAEEARFAALLERYAHYSLFYAEAWAKTDIEVYIQHDDFVWTAGPFLHPDFYRRHIIPLYRRLWEPLRRAGKKVLFCSDGTWDMFIPDIAACGADGFIFEPSNDFDRFARDWGKTHAIIGSKVDCRTLTFGAWEAVRGEIDATLAAARGLPGHFMAVGNHIPANVPDEMCQRYMDYLRAHWARETAAAKEGPLAMGR
ncbi:MAG: hypothetical protein J0L75_17395 [Spirochaetes bacterium]|nr:hypothetical protein [Spirochaetota bacterium]